MIHQREARMAMDYLTGVPVDVLAEREKLSTQRVYQLLNRVAYRVVGLTSIMHVKPNVKRFAALLHEHTNPTRQFRFQPDSPEAFYLELLMEEKHRNFNEETPCPLTQMKSS